MAKIILYSTPTCPFCLQARRYLEEKKVEFEEINVAVDREGLKSLREKSKQIGVPVIDINGTIIIGFNRQKIDDTIWKKLS